MHVSKLPYKQVGHQHMQYTGLYQSPSIGLHSHVCWVLYEGDVGRTGTTKESHNYFLQNRKLNRKSVYTNEHYLRLSPPLMNFETIFKDLLSQFFGNMWKFMKHVEEYYIFYITILQYLTVNRIYFMFQDHFKFVLGKIWIKFNERMITINLIKIII